MSPASGSSLPRRAPSDRRNQLIELAASLFAEHGFAGVTVDDIGAAAGVSGPALYHHFDSKTAMLGEMLISTSEDLVAQARTHSDRSPPERLVDDLIAMHVDFAIRHPSLITVQFRDLPHARPADQRRIRRLQRRYVEMWKRSLLHRAPDTSPVIAEIAVHATFGLINSTPFTPTKDRSGMAEVLRDMARGALSGFGGTRARPRSSDSGGTEAGDPRMQ